MTNAITSAGRVPAILRTPLARIIIGFVAILVPLIIVQIAITSLSFDRLLKNVLLALITPPVVLWCYAAFVRRLESRPVTELGREGALKEAGLGLLLGAILAVLIYGLLAAFGAYSIESVNGWMLVLIALFGTVASAVAEEVVFRGVLFRIMEQGLGSWLALALSALIFGGLHLINPNATVAGAVSIVLTAGVLLGGAYMLTRRLWLPIGIHYAVNFFQAGVFGGPVSGGEAQNALFRPRFHGPDWLTGGSFGIEASIVTVVLGAAAAALILWMASRRGEFRLPPWRSSDARPE